MQAVQEAAEEVEAAPDSRSCAAAAATAGGLVLVGIVLLALCVSAAVRLPCRDVCASDMARLYKSREIDRDHVPFFDRDLEYPPLIGLVMYAAGSPFDGSLRPSFLLNALVLAALAALVTWALWRKYGNRTKRWAFSPPLLIEGLTNWDLLSVAPATIGLLRWEAGGAFWAGVLIGIGAGAKLAPALYVPVLAASCVPVRAWRRMRDVVVGAALGVGVIAIPVYLGAPGALDFFLTFQGRRNPTWGTIWFYLLRDPSMHPWVPVGRLADLGTAISAVLVVGALVVLVRQTARARLHPLCACGLATIAFILANKVYSPQYDLWLVPFLVMIPVRTKLVVHFYASSLIVFVLSAGVSHAIATPAFLYFMGAAVVYRLAMLVLLARDFATGHCFRARRRGRMTPVTDPLERAHLGDAAAEVRAEWRADEEEWTRAAVERWQHRRTLLDVVRECMLRGDTIALRLGDITFTGLVRAIGDDLIALDARDGRVDVRVDEHTPLVMRVHERARTGGTRGDAATSFRARLLELEMDGLDVEIGADAAGGIVCGEITVGRDHVIVHEGEQTETVIALAAVAWVRRAPA